MSKPYIFCLESDYIYMSPILAGIVFQNEWCKISDSTITVNKGYAWDGCSPKYDVLGLFVIGTPDGRLKEGKPVTYYASLIHDVFCQFKRDIPVSKSATVRVFDQMLAEAAFPLRSTYVSLVDWFGPQDFRG